MKNKDISHALTNAMKYLKLVTEAEELKKEIEKQMEALRAQESCEECSEQESSDEDYTDWDHANHAEMGKICQWACYNSSDGNIGFNEKHPEYKNVPQHHDERLQSDLYIYYFTKLFYQKYGFGDE